LGKPSKKQCSFGDRRALREKYFHLAFKDSSSIDSRPVINQQQPFLYFVTQGTFARCILRIFAIFIANENCTCLSSPHFSIEFSKHCSYITYLSARVVTTLENPTHCPYNCYLFSKLCARNSPLILWSDIVNPMSNP
jgi:hypothetical protein